MCMYDYQYVKVATSDSMHEEVRGQPQVPAFPFHLVAADSLLLLCCCATYSMVLHQFLGNSLVSASHFSIEIFQL